MDILQKLYRPSLALLTDLYQLTMAYGYWKNQTAEREAVFHLFFRKNPFQGGYALAAGLEYAVALMENFRFEADDLAYLSTLQGNDGQPLFEQGFLDYLGEMKFSCDVDAIPEGSLAFPHEPLLRVRGPLIQGQLLETALLTILNFQTLIATKAARVVEAAQGDSVLEFGLRRAQGIDGGLSASRAAHIGGCDATSNVLAGRLFGIPVRGTHAHSWIMSFESEPEAFEAYAHAMPNNCVFLVDTYDTLEGVRNAVQVGLRLRARGHELAGIRLDSGDLTQLSKEARKILDEAGFPKAQIVASNDLDEYSTQQLKKDGAKISIWGVGTKLVTAYDQAALGGVYKLGAIRNDAGHWDFKVKLSEQMVKISNPGLLQVRRFFLDGKPVADLLFNEEDGADMDCLMDPLEAHQRKELPEFDSFTDLLVPVFRKGILLYDLPPIANLRTRSIRQRTSLPAALRSISPVKEAYPVGLDRKLHDLKVSIIQRIKNA
jgi:nicotinate phosphoribosyltransferase